MRSQSRSSSCGLSNCNSRLAYSEIVPDEKGATCASFLRRAAAYFPAQGINRIERVTTDNAWVYRYSLRQTSASLTARRKFIRPHCPWQNGKVGRSAQSPL